MFLPLVDYCSDTKQSCFPIPPAAQPHLDCRPERQSWLWRCRAAASRPRCRRRRRRRTAGAHQSDAGPRRTGRRRGCRVQHQYGRHVRSGGGCGGRPARRRQAASGPACARHRVPGGQGRQRGRGRLQTGRADQVLREGAGGARRQTAAHAHLLTAGHRERGCRDRRTTSDTSLIHRAAVSTSSHTADGKETKRAYQSARHKATLSECQRKNNTEG